MKRASPVEVAPMAPAQSLTDRAYAELEEMIVTLKLAPGAAVSEAELSSHLGIGRTPIREALQRLARERLVVILPRRGSDGVGDQRRAVSCGCTKCGARSSG